MLATHPKYAALSKWSR